MERLTVNQLAKLAGVSVRTLHHYDDIGLLKLKTRTESKYRYYGEEELLRLQQILFYRELDLPLAKIVEILDDASFDTEKALKSHKEELLKRKRRTAELLKTIDKTLKSFSQKKQKMKTEDMYKGFSKEQAEAYEKEAKEKYGEKIIDRSKDQINKMGKEAFEKLLADHEEISKKLANLMHRSPSDREVQDLVKQHYAFVRAFNDITPQMYRSFADLYVNDERFKKNYNKHKEGFAEFLSKAIIVFCEINFSS